MSVPLKYIGAQQRYFDTVDGSREQWTPGDTSDVADGAALGLLATGYFGPVEGANNAYTAAQLSAMALAGTLTPLATYVPSDASPPYQLWARDASTLVAPDGFFANSAASMAALSLAVVGARCTRTDDVSGGPLGTEYMLMRLPSTRPHHWKPVYNGAAHMLFSARPNAADVPYGTVIAGTDILNARFIAQTKAGITDWYPENGEQVIARWVGQAPLYTASSSGQVVVQDAMWIPAGVAGLYGSLVAKFTAGQVYNNTSSGIPTLWLFARLRRAGPSEASPVTPAFNEPYGCGTILASSSSYVYKKAVTQVGEFHILGDPMLYVHASPQITTNAYGYQIHNAYRSVETDFSVDLWSASNPANISGEFIRAEISVRG